MWTIDDSTDGSIAWNEDKLIHYVYNGSAWVKLLSAYGDAETLTFGDSADYLFVYNSTGTQFELWSTDTNGAGLDGLIFSVPDGADDINFAGEIDVASGKITVGAADFLYDAEADSFTGSFFIGTGGADLSHSTGDEGYYNVGLGIQCLRDVTTGWNNNAFGRGALRACTTGTSNLGIGTLTLLALTTGHSNTACGFATLGTLTSASYNVAFGQSAGRYQNDGSSTTNPSYGCYIGHDTTTGAASPSREVCIGAYTQGNGTHTVTIGSPSNTDVYLSGDVRPTVGYKSVDGTSGWTGSIPNTFTSITVKDGLITGYT